MLVKRDGLTPEQMTGQLEPHHEPERKLHLCHCDHILMEK